MIDLTDGTIDLTKDVQHLDLPTVIGSGVAFLDNDSNPSKQCERLFNEKLLEDILSLCKVSFKTKPVMFIHVLSLRSGLEPDEAWHTIDWGPSAGIDKLMATEGARKANANIVKANAAMLTISFLPLVLKQTPAFVVTINEGEILNVIRNDVLHIANGKMND